MAEVERRVILVVDDDDAVRQLVCRALRIDGYEVWSAGDGVEALEVAEERGDGLHLVITDVRMPRMGGCDLGKELARRYPRVPVLYVSAYSDGELPPGVPFLQKPFGLAALKRAVDQLLPPVGRAQGA